MTLSIIGIDISKLKFDLCLLRDNGKLKHKVFPNTASGFAQLSAWLQKQKVETCAPLPGSHWYLW